MLHPQGYYGRSLYTYVLTSEMQSLGLNEALSL